MTTLIKSPAVSQWIESKAMRLIWAATSLLLVAFALAVPSLLIQKGAIPGDYLPWHVGSSVFVLAGCWVFALGLFGLAPRSNRRHLTKLSAFAALVIGLALSVFYSPFTGYMAVLFGVTGLVLGLLGAGEVESH